VVVDPRTDRAEYAERLHDHTVRRARHRIVVLRDDPRVRRLAYAEVSRGTP
jgi:hypothetical protein